MAHEALIKVGSLCRLEHLCRSTGEATPTALCLTLLSWPAPVLPPSRLQVSEVEVNGQIEAVCESVFSEMESQAVDALDLPVPGCFRMRSHSYVRAIEKGCSQDEEGEGPGPGGVVAVVAAGGRRGGSPPRGSTTTVRTIQSSTGQRPHAYFKMALQIDMDVLWMLVPDCSMCSTLNSTAVG